MLPSPRPNYLDGFLSLGTGQELVQGQAKLMRAWNTSGGISKLIANDATQAPVNLPANFKSGPLNTLLGKLTILYYATWQVGCARGVPSPPVVC